MAITLFTGCAMVEVNTEKINARVIATIGDTEITYGEYKEQLDYTIALYEAYLFGAGYFSQPENAEQLEQTRNDLVDSLIEFEALYQTAMSQGIEVTEEDIDEEIEEIIETQGDDSFEAQLESSNLTLEEYREVLKPDLYVRALEEEVMKDFSITEAEAEAYYEENKTQYLDGEDLATASHILVESEDDAEMVLDLAKKGNTDFATLATTFSKDSSASEGGSLGEFNRTTMVAEFTAAVFDQGHGVGLVPEYIETEFGYHIIYIEAIEFAEQKTYDEVKEEVMEDATEVAYDAEWAAKSEEFVAAIEVVKYENVIHS